MKTPIQYILLITFFFSFSTFADMPADIADIQQAWAKANYDTPEDQQEKVFETLVKQARDIVAAHPDKAEPKIWLAIVLSTDAGVTGGFGALGKVKEARKFLEEAEAIDATVLDGSVYTSLGSLYYQVPGWPIGFGNDDKAEQYLKKALEANPDGIDPNYFYADFMLEEGKPAEAKKYFQKALAAPARPNRPLADQGRKGEIAVKLSKVNEQLN
jgi:tetratricopeptide (TPR) repeat protein